MNLLVSADCCRRGAAGLLFWLLASAAAGVLPAQETTPSSQNRTTQESANRDSKESHAEGLPKPLTHYMGREIATTMHYTGAEWLVRNEREREERCSLLLANLGLERGMTVCDLGCGNGFHALPIAQLVGERGRVLGVDAQPEMLELLRERMDDAGIANITPVLGSWHDPRLPDGSCDLILLVDVYHEFSYPEQMLVAIRRALKPDGLVALVEFRAEDPEVPIKPLHKMSKEQILREWPPNGFELEREFDELPWQHLMFFRKDDGN